MKFKVMNEDFTKKECFNDVYNKLVEYSKNHPDYFVERRLYDAIDNLSEEGIIDIPAEYCVDPENVTEDEASRYILELIDNLSAMQILKLKHPVLREAKEEKICCICKQPYEGYGNNAESVVKNGRCCDKCNIETVLKKRIEMMKDNKNLKKSKRDEALTEAYGELIIDEHYPEEAEYSHKIYLPTDTSGKVELKIFATMNDTRHGREVWDIGVDLDTPMKLNAHINIDETKLADYVDNYGHPYLSSYDFDQAEEVCENVREYFNDIDQDDFYRTFVEDLGCDPKEVEKLWIAPEYVGDTDISVNKLDHIKEKIKTNYHRGSVCTVTEGTLCTLQDVFKGRHLNNLDINMLSWTREGIPMIEIKKGQKVTILTDLVEIGINEYDGTKMLEYGCKVKLDDYNVNFDAIITYDFDYNNLDGFVELGRNGFIFETTLNESYTALSEKKDDQIPGQISIFDDEAKDETAWDKLVKKYPQLKNPIRIFEIVPEQKGTSTEEHIFANIERAKNYIKDANLTKSDIDHVVGVDIDSLFESLNEAIEVIAFLDFTDRNVDRNATMEKAKADGATKVLSYKSIHQLTVDAYEHYKWDIKKLIYSNNKENFDFIPSHLTEQHNIEFRDAVMKNNINESVNENLWDILNKLANQESLTEDFGDDDDWVYFHYDEDRKLYIGSGEIVTGSGKTLKAAVEACKADAENYDGSMYSDVEFDEDEIDWDEEDPEDLGKMVVTWIEADSDGDFDADTFVETHIKELLQKPVDDELFDEGETYDNSNDVDADIENVCDACSDLYFDEWWDHEDELKTAIESYMETHRGHLDSLVDWQ